MNPPNKSTTVFPQTEEIPVPLEIHPSVSPLAAELLMKTSETLAAHPSCYDQNNGITTEEHSGCIICIAEKHAGCSVGRALSEPSVIGLTRKQWDNIFTYEYWPLPLKPVLFNLNTGRTLSPVPAPVGIARIEHFLRTGQ